MCFLKLHVHTHCIFLLLSPLSYLVCIILFQHVISQYSQIIITNLTNYIHSHTHNISNFTRLHQNKTTPLYHTHYSPAYSLVHSLVQMYIIFGRTLYCCPFQGLEQMYIIHGEIVPEWVNACMHTWIYFIVFE